MSDVSNIMAISGLVVNVIAVISTLGLGMEHRIIARKSNQVAQELLEHNKAIHILTQQSVRVVGESLECNKAMFFMMQESMQISRELLEYNKTTYILIQESVQIARERLEHDKAMYMASIVGDAITVRRSRAQSV